MGGGENLAVRFPAHKSRHWGFVTSTVERVTRQPGHQCHNWKDSQRASPLFLAITESNLQHRMWRQRHRLLCAKFRAELEGKITALENSFWRDSDESAL